MRKIIHIDMDAFYASVEQRDHPELRGKPIAVGSAAGRGVVMTCSYEAREFGVRSAMPSSRAQRLCPGLIFVKPRMQVYQQVSREIRAVFCSWTPLVEPLSLDEAYLDVTENLREVPKAIRVASEIKKEIRERTGLTASAGVSYCKFLAKMASDLNKPDGLSFIAPEQAMEFLMALPVRKFHGIGAATAARFEKLGVHTGADMLRFSEAELRERFGKMGGYFYRIVRGIDDRAVQPDRPTKSVSVENTFGEDVLDLDKLKTELREQARTLWRRIEKKGLEGRRVTLKIKYADFSQVSRSRSFPEAFTDPEAVADTAIALLSDTEAGVRAIRLVGVGLSAFEPPGKPGAARGGQLSINFPS